MTTSRQTASLTSATSRAVTTGDQSTEAPKRTPTPWSLRAFDTEYVAYGADGVQVLATSWHHCFRKPYPLKAEARANIEFMLRAVNAHDDLVAALEAARLALLRVTHGDEYGEIDAELKQIHAAQAEAEAAS